jgi:hypothetical protein
MESTTRAQPREILEINELQKGLNRVGLTLSESELNELNIGNTISLEGMELSEIGSVFILASAISAVNSGKPKKPITFRDLPQAFKESACCCGLPLYCWSSNFLGKCCLYLTLLDGKPAVRTCCQI